MNKIKAIVKSLRLRTLPLSLAGVILGMSLAAADYRVSLAAALLTALTTVCLQILSNLANELGDVLHGASSELRQGPRYGLDSGELSVRDMKRLVALFVLLCVASGTAMIKCSFGTLLSFDSVCLMMLGAAAIGAALKYTLGRNPYGYRGLGDIYVFIFFGLVSIMGGYFVTAHTFGSWMLFPAAAMGFFSTGVLNVNNIRDIEADRDTRVTVAMKLGERRAKIYQTVLIALGWACMLAYCSMRFFDPRHYLFIISLPLFVMHLISVWKNTGKGLDRSLPLLVMASFLFSVSAGAGFLLFLL